MTTSTEAIVLKRTTKESESIMTKATNKPAATKAASTKAAAAKKGTNKEVIQAVAKTPEVVESVKPAAPLLLTHQPKIEEAPVVSVPLLVVNSAPSKASKANAIFAEMFNMPQVPARKDMIKRAVAEAGLTEKGAATYLQNFKSKHGLVNRTPATA